MSTEVRLRHGSTAQHENFTGAPAEVTVDLDKKTAVVHDGSTAGGFPLAHEDVVNDLAAASRASGIDDVPFPAGVTKMKAITPFDGRHRTLFTNIFPVHNGKWVLAYADSSEHHQGFDDTHIKCQTSHSKGMQWSDPVTIYSEPGYKATNSQQGIMGDGRLGIISSRVNEANYDANPPVFIYSDDDGKTWNSTVLSHIPAWGGDGIDIYPWPASAGGHDQYGYIVYGMPGRLGNDIIALTTVDNGATWTQVLCAPGDPEKELSTAAVVRLGDTDRWVMLVRDATQYYDGDGKKVTNFTNGIAYKSTDMVNWTGPYDTGQLLNNNPHNALYTDGGKIYWLAAARRHTTFVRYIDPLYDGFVHQWADAEELWASDFTSGWPGWSELASVYGMEGHPKFFKDAGKWYCVFGYYRASGHSVDGSIIGLMSKTLVSCSIDLPSSAAVSRGSNEHGSYEIYPDGRLVCKKVITDMGPISTETGPIFRTNSTDLGEWPIPFIDTPSVSLNATKATGFAQTWAGHFNEFPTNTDAGNAVIFRPFASAETDHILTVTATGYWFNY